MPKLVLAVRGGWGMLHCYLGEALHPRFTASYAIFTHTKSLGLAEQNHFSKPQSS